MPFTLDVDIQVQTESSGYWGVLFRQANGRNYYIFAISTGNYMLRVVKDGNWNTLVGWTDIPVAFDEEQTNNLKLIAQGSTFSFFLNGEFVIKYTDDTLQGGGVFLAAGAFAEPGLAIRFDNVVIRADPTVQQLLNQAYELYSQGRESFNHWEIKKALDLFQGSLACYKQLNWKRKQADLMEWVGGSQYRLSAYREAITSYERALSFYRDAGNRRNRTPQYPEDSVCTRISTSSVKSRNSILGREP